MWPCQLAPLFPRHRRRLSLFFSLILHHFERGNNNKINRQFSLTIIHAASVCGSSWWGSTCLNSAFYPTPPKKKKTKKKLKTHHVNMFCWWRDWLAVSADTYPSSWNTKNYRFHAWKLSKQPQTKTYIYSEMSLFLYYQSCAWKRV